MTDAVKNVEAVYAKWENKNPYIQNGILPQQSQLKSSQLSNGYDATIAKGREEWMSKFGSVAPPAHRRTRRFNQSSKKSTASSIDKLHANHSLGTSYKTQPTVRPSVGRLRPYAGRCCDCMPDSKNYLFTESIKSSGITNVFMVNTMTGDNDWMTRMFYHFSFVMQRRLTHKYPDLTMTVLTSPHLVNAIQRTVQEEAANSTCKTTISSIQKKHENRAKSILKKMSARISNQLIRFTGWFLHKLLSRLLSSIVVHKGQIQLLQQFCKKEVPVIFLPTHRSHLDYILLTFILFNYDIKAPYVAAGDNLLIPFFGSLMRGLGGFFIRRKLDKGTEKRDHVYRAVMNTYMNELLRNNENLEFFIEGGRTRSGKSIYPKGGLLSVVVDAYNNGVIPEAYLVPVSISYDKLVDGNFTKEQMGESKVYETFWRTVLAIYKVLMSRFGLVRMDFAQPFSLKEYLETSKNYPSISHSLTNEFSVSSETDSRYFESKRTDLVPSASDSSMDDDTREMRHVVQSLAEHVVYASINVQSILSTHLLAFIMLNEFRQGADINLVKITFEALQHEILMRDHDVGFSGDINDVLNHAQHLLGDRLVRKELVKMEGDKNSSDESSVSLRLIPVTTLPNVLELSYYANVVSPLFAAESVLVNTIYSIVQFDEWVDNGSKELEITFSKEKLFREATLLCSILKYEFIFCPPCQTLEVALAASFDRLRNSSILMTEDIIKGGAIDTREQKQWAKRYANHLCFNDQDSDSDDNWTTNDQTCMLNQDEDLMKKFWFIKRILSPLLETYYVTACHLVQLIKHDIPENDFIKSLHNILKERVVTGTTCYAESVAMDTIKNAIRGFDHMKVIQSYQAAKVDMIGLTADYMEEEKLFTFIRRLESYRDR